MPPPVDGLLQNFFESPLKRPKNVVFSYIPFLTTFFRTIHIDNNARIHHKTLEFSQHINRKIFNYPLTRGIVPKNTPFWSKNVIFSEKTGLFVTSKVVTR